MQRRLFGTDGIRGTSNTYPMTAEVALGLGRAAGSLFRRSDHQNRVVIGKDTRLSGYMIENALAAGFLSAGMRVMLTGPVPTPAVAFLTRSLRADIGVMVSASHNPFEDNGIKLFGPDGFKLSDAIEVEIEAQMANMAADGEAPAAEIGRAMRYEDARGRYVENLKSSFPRGVDLAGRKIVVDCANGAAYHIAPELFFELGAEVDQHRRHAQWAQHQRRLRLDLPVGDPGGGPGPWCGPRDRAGRRRRPGGARRRAW